MANFAVLDGINVINVIVAESKEIAEEATGKTCILYSATDRAEPNGTYENGVFIPAKPYPSWILNNNNTWDAPIPYPNDGIQYMWNENILNWEKI